MSTDIRRILSICVAFLSLAGTQLHAEPFFASNGISLARFDSNAPSIVTSFMFSGLQSGETILGLDLRPANGLLYGISSASRLYTINTTNGAVTQVTGGAAFTLSGNNFGMDFNPQVDRIRVVSDTEQNIRLNPNDGGLAGTDTSLAPAGNVVAAAYDRNDNNPATLTTLYGIDSTSGQLVLIGGIDGTPSPNGGAVTNVGSLLLGTNLAPQIGFDISGLTAIAYATITTFAPPGRLAGIIAGGIPTISRLYTINLATGAATLVGTIGNGTTAYSSLTSATAIPEPSSVMLIGVSALLLGLGYRARRAKV